MIPSAKPYQFAQSKTKINANSDLLFSPTTISETFGGPPPPLAPLSYSPLGKRFTAVELISDALLPVDRRIFASTHKVGYPTSITASGTVDEVTHRKGFGNERGCCRER